ncbi:alpha/beta hydrolase family protein [Noviherbaspirillum galbum]|uniref:Alpha/beta hydrolase n=1 Tax=Noviherbaspirillum galbum TaxID=2709383 RepID=A0A6B3SRZ3_9BURK|nr:alpha/beta hydrolase [Noviherbaspirillum galbum]NEX61212.1 alpha/beta hydrolase [Noviherbaspirillum galbum]
MRSQEKPVAQLNGTRSGKLPSALCALLGAALLGGCLTPPPAVIALPVPEETRPQDARTFIPNVAALPFAALPGTTAETDRWTGVLDGAAYRIEVPRNWNGMLVMYTHGYAGTGPNLNVSNPAIRRHLIENGYAWAASSYSKNYYDVRAGLEDTNALALAFNGIAAANNRPLHAPLKRYIMGPSMGGHIAAAAVEQETLATAVHKVRYDGAVPMCGVLGDTDLYNYFGAYQMAAMELAGMPATSYPVPDFAALRQKITDALWTAYPSATTPRGDRLKAIVMNLTGGQRPIFEEGFRVKPLQDAVWTAFAGDGTINGVLTRNIINTTGIVYRFSNAGAPSEEDIAFNRAIYRIAGTPEANRPRSDGMRWVPKVHGQFNVPVVTMHTLGDLYVPFGMEQLYRRRAMEQGNDKLLVQRAIRAPGHCDFSVAEQAAAFQAMADWEQKGIKPAGDDVLTPAVVADKNYGCNFTNNTAGKDDLPALAPTRASLPACTGAQNR